MSKYFTTGVMCAGKTSDLIREANLRQNPIVIKATTKKDTHCTGILVSRDGTSIPCYNYCIEDENLYEFIQKLLQDNRDATIFIDEVQFIDTIDISKVFVIPNPIHFYGLDIEWTGEYFETSEYLGIMCNKLSRVQLKCQNGECPNKATHNYKVMTKENTCKTDEDAEYLSICKECYNDFWSKLVPVKD